MSIKMDEKLLDLSESQIEEIRNEIERVYKQNSSQKDRVLLDVDLEDNSSDNFIKRNQFSRDKDRILFCKAFRRLEHKAQVYSHEKGDHFRTRLTHTLEVMQVARSIAINLKLNENLAEAIALGHDIGHTPFGHAGEEILDDVMRGNYDLGGKLKYSINFGGFKHNFYSLKILEIMERKYEDITGLNLTWQVLEGILNHTKIKKGNKKWKLDRFMGDSSHKTFLNELIENTTNDRTFSATLEGQIVNIADEIAQRQHDLDDGLRDNDLHLRYEDIIRELCCFIDDAIEISKLKASNSDYDDFEIKLLVDLKYKIKTKQKSKNRNYKWNSLIRDIIDYFIRDVTLNSIKNIRDSNFEEVNIQNGKKIVTKNFISFSDVGAIMDEKIESYIKNRILNSYNVNRFDGKANFVIKQLFKAYYTNPRQMPKEDLKRLSKIVSRNSENIYPMEFMDGKFKECKEFKDINFNSSPKEDIDGFIETLKLNMPFILENVDNLSDLHVYYNVDRGNNFRTSETDKKLTKINNKELNEMLKERNFYAKQLIDNCVKDNSIMRLLDFQMRDLFIKCLLENHYAYLSVICDYIAGMTDNFAISEFKKLYLV